MSRVPRHNLAAEASVLGGIIWKPDVLVELATLETGDFYHPAHRVVFEAVRNLEATQQPIDVVTLETEIAKRGRLESIGGVGFLGELVLKVPTFDNVLQYARLVQEDATARRLTVAASDITEQSYDPAADVGELVSSAVQTITHIDDRRADSGGTAGEIVKRRIHELEGQWAAKARGEHVWLGAPTGIKKLDAKIGGYPFGDVAMIAGRPGMGKSAAALAATEASVQAGFGVHVFAPEGGERMYADRLISRRAKVPIEKLRNGDISHEEAKHISLAMMWYGQRGNQWRIDDRGGYTAVDIVRQVRKWRRKIKTRLVVVDYLQILARTKDISENDAIEEIINVFGMAAPGDDIAWLLVSQLNRDVEKRPDKRPQMSDLRGSGALEQVARLIVCPYRGAYYYDEPKRDIDFECDRCDRDARCIHAPTTDEFQTTAQVLIVKNNQGEPGRVFANWSGPTTEIW